MAAARGAALLGGGLLGHLRRLASGRHGHDTAGGTTSSALITEAASVAIASPVELEAERADRRAARGCRPTRRRRTSRTRGPAAGGGCATSWTTSLPRRWASSIVRADRKTRPPDELVSDEPRRDRARPNGSAVRLSSFPPGNNDAWTAGPADRAAAGGRRRGAAGRARPSRLTAHLSGRQLRRPRWRSRSGPTRRTCSRRNGTRPPALPGGPPEPPYDEAGWTLPFKMGMHVAPVTEAVPRDPRAGHTVRRRREGRLAQRPGDRRRRSPPTAMPPRSP